MDKALMRRRKIEDEEPSPQAKEDDEDLDKYDKKESVRNLKSKIFKFFSSYQCSPFVILVYFTTYTGGLLLMPVLTKHPTFRIEDAKYFYPACCVVVGVCICLFIEALFHFCMLIHSAEPKGFLTPSQDGNVVILTIFGLTGLTHSMMATEYTPVFINYCGRAMHLGRLSEWSAIVFFVVRVSSKLDERYTEADSWRAGLFQLISVFTGSFAMVVDEKYTFYITMFLSHLFYFDIFRDVYRHQCNVVEIEKTTKSVARRQAIYRALTMSHVIAVVFTAYTLVWWIGAFHWISDEAEMTTYSVLDLLIKGMFTSLVIKARVVSSVQNEYELKVALQGQLRAFVQYALHELRVPLNTMTLATDELKNSATAKEQKSSIGLLEHMLGVVSRLLSDVLDYQRIACGRLRLEKETLSTRALVRDVLQQISPIASRKSIKLVEKWETAAFDPYIVGDKFKLLQVLRNLMENATKFSPSGETITVKICDHASKVKMIRVCVSDKGVGISKEDQKRLFKPFAQISPGKLQKGGGTGLGLYISRTIVEAHDGEMILESEEGKGTTFSFTLHSLEAPIVPPEDAFPDDPVDDSMLKILIVDDSKSNRKLLANLCRRLGHIADEAESGKAALNTCLNLENGKKSSSYDVVLMDQWMPGMTGVECTRALIKEGFTGAILGITGDDDAANKLNKDSMPSAGALTCLSKPITRNRLVKGLKEARKHLSATIEKQIGESKR
eukprot:CAMPEP_0184505018 /NCGR_PEP_ID=MMETSP0113_2-20130426/52767_1 /TAXON_ID=91329 /ORGANISM="Norrisiella sphaerica, Strain BC52" /LENGTH=725 /DNA_ID=CAMNT_0026894685 /DNA_START=68 /DNA_END=2245 /DNA_ORIENTATION=-